MKTKGQRSLLNFIHLSCIMWLLSINFFSFIHNYLNEYKTVNNYNVLMLFKWYSVTFMPIHKKNNITYEVKLPSLSYFTCCLCYVSDTFRIKKIKSCQKYCPFLLKRHNYLILNIKLQYFATL